MKTQAGFTTKEFKQEIIVLAIKWSNVAYALARKLKQGSVDDGESLAVSAILLTRSILHSDNLATSLEQANIYFLICRDLISVAKKRIWLNQQDIEQAEEILDRLHRLLEQEKRDAGIS